MGRPAALVSVAALTLASVLVFPANLAGAARD